MALSATTALRHPADRVLSALVNEDFQRSAAAEFGASLVSLSVDGDISGPFTLTVERTAPTDRVPDMIKKLIGSTVTFVQTDRYSAPAEDGSRTAETTVDIKGAPLSVVGQQTLKPAGDGSELELTGEVKSSVPFIGGKISKLAEPVIGKVLSRQAAALDRWLDSH